MLLRRETEFPRRSTMTAKSRFVLLTLCALLIAELALGTPIGAKRQSTECRRTKVLVLGGGIAGVTAAQTLSNNSIDDFLIVEYSESPSTD